MSFKILYVTATAIEAERLRRQTDKIPKRFDIDFLITGVGSMAMAWNLKNHISINGKPDLAINAGIAGSFSDEYSAGEVVMPLTDCFADSGIEDNEAFLTLFESGFIGLNEFPYRDGILRADPLYAEKMKNILRPVKAITVNTATGSERSRLKLVSKFNPDIETMEGATFFYICCRENIPFLAIRAISNRVEARNKNNWKINLALENLSEKMIDVLLKLD